MKSFSVEELRKSDCPNLWHDLLAAGRYRNGRVEVDDHAADAILARCKGVHGLGDVVAMVAKPVARVLDAAFGTKLADCGGCAERQKRLNQKFPL